MVPGVFISKLKGFFGQLTCDFVSRFKLDLVVADKDADMEIIEALRRGNLESTLV